MVEKHCGLLRHPVSTGVVRCDKVRGNLQNPYGHAGCHGLQRVVKVSSVKITKVSRLRGLARCRMTVSGICHWEAIGKPFFGARQLKVAKMDGRAGAKKYVKP